MPLGSEIYASGFFWSVKNLLTFYLINMPKIPPSFQGKSITVPLSIMRVKFRQAYPATF